MEPSQEFVITRSYCRWVDDLGRRETWEEAVKRYFDFMKSKFSSDPTLLDTFYDFEWKDTWETIEKSVVNMEVMPSMRALWSAGPSLQKNNITGYNCCCLAIKDLKSIPELFYILMCGTGVGFSIEKEFISQLPEVKPFNNENIKTYLIDDSREGWADSLYFGIVNWFEGNDVYFDYSNIRERGTRLKTVGGRASGPDPLKKLHNFVRKTILSAQGRQLSSVECLDICNNCGQAVVVGGIRRASGISFSDLSDTDIRDAKTGDYPLYRGMSNNTAVYYKKPSKEEFLKEWKSLASSGTGERGIFNLEAAKLASPRRESSDYFRTNPCGEILLNSYYGEFCNLTEVVIRPEDNMVTLFEKVLKAVILGTLQSTLTDFPYIRPEFKEMCEKERLLGVSLTGQLDNPNLLTEDILRSLRHFATRVNEKLAKRLGINSSVAITCGKPSGTVSQAVNCASGAHPRYSQYYIRRYRISALDPLYKMMAAQGAKFSPENGEGPEAVENKRKLLQESGKTEKEAKLLVPDWDESQVNTWVIEFPVKSPLGCLTRHDVDANAQIDWYLKIKENWCEHNQSMTVYVKDNEWDAIGEKVYENFDRIVGITFLPFDNSAYKQMPYEEIDEETYKKMLANFPKIDYSKLSEYEREDSTEGAALYACTSGSCEL